MVDKKIIEVGVQVKKYIKDSQYSLVVHLFKDTMYDVTYNTNAGNVNYLDVVKTFLNSGMNVNQVDDEGNVILFEEALGHEFDLRYFEFLLGKGIELNGVNNNGDTVLDKIEVLCMDCYNKVNIDGHDFEISYRKKYNFYRDLILLLKGYGAKCGYEI